MTWQMMWHFLELLVNNLRYLYLSDGYVGKIPVEISHLTRLEVLDISQSYNIWISERLESPKFSILFQNLTELTELYLDGIDVSAAGTHWCQAISSSLPNLRVLSLYGTNLSGPIDQSLAKLQSLSVIQLGGSPNNISGPILGFFSNFSNLTVLNLRDCGLRGTFPKQIFQVPNLQTIDLSLNTELHGSLPEFPKNGSLRSLNLSQTSFSGSLHDSIGNLNMLSTLDLSNCNFTGSIPKSIENLTKLVDLYLSSNMFNGPISSIHWENLINLAHLSLNDNQLVGSIPSSLYSLPLLPSLDLSHNNFTGRFPKIFNLSSSSVTSIDLSFNNLEGPVPVSIFNFPELSSLTLSSNNFSAFPFNGPQVLFFLEEIHLSHNSLLVLYNGSNSSYSSFPRITDFRLDSNKLRTIPVFLRNLGHLKNLDLSENQIQGQLPNWICNASGLLALNVRKNNITGMISNLEFPEDLGALDLSQNQIEGQFPKSLARCKRLQFLNLEENQITDTFPCLLKNISDLRVLALRSNNFYGGIGCPVVKTNATWPALQILDLAHNNFNGEVPGFSLTTWQAMKDNTTSGFLSTVDGSIYMAIFSQVNEYNDMTDKNIINDRNSFTISYEPAITITSKGLKMNLTKIPIVLTLIDFSCNNFSGSIPKEMGALKYLYFLNLSSNTFTGEIPSSFGYMQQLESLDLSQNKLSGQIPQQLANLNFLAFLNLSNNQLVGKIPASTQISTFPRDSFIGNKGLSGPPLTVDNKAGLSPPPTLNGSHPNSTDEIDWDLISVEIGFVFGFAVAVGSLVFFKRWSKCYYRSKSL